MLELFGNTVFFHAVNSFKNYFHDCAILFIYRESEPTKQFIEKECISMQIDAYTLIPLSEPTQGQADTVFLGLEKAHIADDENILIFNIDTFRPNFKLPIELDFHTLDGYLEVFEAPGEQWSFVLPENEESTKVIKTAEKERISSLCSSGLYYFKYTRDFKDVFSLMFQNDERTKEEYYIAPMYNHLIQRKKEIHYHKIDLDEIVFCGTPSEYEALLE